MRRLALAILFVLTLLPAGSAWAPHALAAPADQPSILCFRETGHCVQDPFRQFWLTHGGLPIYGFPITEQLVENGRTVQYFERQRLEFFPENPPQFQVQGGLLGRQIAEQRGLTGTPPFQPAPVFANPPCLHFTETAHNLCFGFRSSWERNGALPVFGFPISEEFTETNPPPPAGDGKPHTVQYFERARFEYHPENPIPFQVQLGLLGRLVVPPGPMTLDAGTVASVQTVLDFFRDINAPDPQGAFNLLIAGGGQTLQQFIATWTNTVQVTVQMTTPGTSTGPILVPLSYQEVVNDPTAPMGQRVRQFTGAYVLQQVGSVWRIAQRIVSEVSGPLPQPEFADPVAVVRAYYDALNRRDFARAYTDWDNVGQASGQTFAQFAGGFGDTTSVVADVGQPGPIQGAAGSLFADVPVVVIATHTDGTTHTFCGTYSLRRSNVSPFDQFGWRLFSAHLVETANVQLGSDAERRLLTGGCPL